MKEKSPCPIKLIFPKDNSSVLLVDKVVKDYIDAYYRNALRIDNDYGFNGFNWGFNDAVKVEEFYKLTTNNYPGRPVHFKFEIKNKSKLLISKDKNFKYIAINKIINKDEIDIYNLEKRTTYFWKIVDLFTKETSETHSFTTDSYPRLMTFGKLINVRDFGGKIVKDGGIIKQGLLFRGAEVVAEKYVVTRELGLNQQTQTHQKSITKKDAKELSKFLKNGVDLDLREDYESNFQVHSDIPNAKYIRLTGSSYDYLIDYLNENLKNNIKNTFALFANADKSPIYCHCWGGADRTGTICFLLGGLLGMSYTDLVIDYELTTFAGNERVHYRKNPIYEWEHFIEMVTSLENYRDKNLLENDISAIIEHFLINRCYISKNTIETIKKVFIEKISQ